MSLKNRKSNENEHIVWFYKVRNSSDPSWIPFGDIDNELIEEAFSQNKKELQLDHFLIDLKKFIQIDKEDSTKQKTIERRIVRRNEAPLRSERFYTSEKLVQPLNENATNDSRFINECRKRYHTMPTDQLLENAAEGIIKEGIALGSQVEAEWIAEQLRSVKGKPKAERESCIIYIYTFESFLYRLVNRTLRENDHSKLDTLGAFCQILFQTDCSPTTEKVGYSEILYRGTQLDKKMIESYKQSIGKIKTWDAFTSTSKNRKQAEAYGNVLFIINRDQSTRYRYSGMDISAISYYPLEEEVLIRAARNFRVEKVEEDLSKGKCFIYLSLC